MKKAAAARIAEEDKRAEAAKEKKEKMPPALAKQTTPLKTEGAEIAEAARKVEAAKKAAKATAAHVLAEALDRADKPVTLKGRAMVAKMAEDAMMKTVFGA